MIIRMKKLLIIFLLSITPILLYSQRDSYEYLRGYKSGFHSSCGCNDQIPNIERINRIGSFSNGYNDGVIDGRIYLSNKSKKSNDYYDQLGRYKPDVDLVYRALEQKTRILNERRTEMRNFCNTIERKIINTKNARNLTENELTIARKYLSFVEKASVSDLADNYNWNEIVKYLNQINNLVYNW